MPNIPFIGGISFMNSLGWYAFSSLAILILLYLMRPKPAEKNIPSLMFFMAEKGFSKQSAFLRYLMSSLLFLLQFIALGILAFSITMPFTTVYGNQAIEGTVIVLDTSASMQTGNRFAQAVEHAKNSLNGKVSIVLAQNYPVQVLENGGKEEALKVLSTVTPTDTTSNIGDAMMLSGDIIGQRTGKVYVISDFISTEGPEPLVAKRILTAKGIPVEFVNVGGKAKNAGIISMTLGKFTSKAVVKNYDAEEKQVTLSIISEAGTKKMIKKLLPTSIETFDFSTPSGKTELKIDEKDEFDADNHAYISADNIKKIKVLLITNSEKSFLKTALEASKDIKLDIAEPPVIPNLNYDVIIMHSISPDLLLPDFYQETMRKVKNGSSLIITYQDGVEKVGGQLLPVTVGNQLNNTRITTSIVNKFTSDIDFGTSFKIYNATPQKGAVVIAEAEDSGGASAIVMKDEGNGKIIYYGIIDDYSDFKTTVHYPIFWNKLINFLTETEDLNDYNFKTGKMLSDSSGNKQYMNKAGFYTVGNKGVSASILSEKESDVGKENTALIEEEKAFSVKESKEKRDVKFEQYLLIAGFIVILLELLYIKRRGDF